MRLALLVLVVGCGAGAAEARAAPAPPLCRPATYACSVMAARGGVTGRGSIDVRTGETSGGEILGPDFRCALTLSAAAPEDHALDVACEDASFTLREPSHAFESNGGWSVEASCWYAQAGHREGCETCRAVDYCEGPDVP